MEAHFLSPPLESFFGIILFFMSIAFALPSRESSLMLVSSNLSKMSF